MKQAGELGCPGAKPECMCKSKQYQAKLEECAKSCSAQESDQMRKVGRKICNDIRKHKYLFNFLTQSPAPFVPIIFTRSDQEMLLTTIIDALMERDNEDYADVNELDAEFLFDKELVARQLPTGLFPTGLFPTGFPTGLPTGLFPTGLIPTGFPTGLFPTGIFPTGLFPTGLIPSGLIPGHGPLPMNTEEPMPEMTKRAKLPINTRTPADKASTPGETAPEPTYHTHARDFAM